MNAHPAFHQVLPTERLVPLVLDSPHSGNEYPEDFGHAITRDALRRAEDAFVDELYASAPGHGATLIAARFPRSYIDANRSILDIDAQLLAESWPGPVQAGSKAQRGIGLVWRLIDTGEPIYARRLSVDEVKRRITHFHQPYQRAVKDALDVAHAHFGAVWHLNCHSMQSVSGSISEEGPGKARPDFVLGDRDGTTCAPEFTHFVGDFLRTLGYSVAVNDPYKGVELVRAFSDPASNRHSLQVEVNRKLYLDERSLERSSGFRALRSDLDRLIGAVADFAAERGSHACAAGHDPDHQGHRHGHHDHAHHAHGHAKDGPKQEHSGHGHHDHSRKR